MRADLMALSEDSLVQMSNAGLVKRGVRDLAAGQEPTLGETPDGVIEARFADGTLTRLAPGRMPAEASCTCPAGGMCRHRIALVLTYQRAAQALAPASAPIAWDPGTLDADAFEAALSAGERLAVSRLTASPLTIALDHGTAPTARLPMATVRFPVPGEVAYARCDCAATTRCAHVALSIRAFRAAEGRAEVTLGGTSPSQASEDLAPNVDAVLSRLLVEGVVSGMAAHERGLDRARRAASAQAATWLVLALDELTEQIGAYEKRSARYDEERVLNLAGELYARTHAEDRIGALGLGEAMETAMAKTRLISLGARVRARGPETAVAIILADTDTGAVMQLERRFEPAPSEARLTTQAVRKRQLAVGLPVEGLARGQILTAVARRRADGALALGAGGQGRTMLMARAVVQDLPAPLRVTDLAALADDFARRPPSFLRPRNHVQDVHVFDIEAMLGQAWTPGTQVWQAAARLPRNGSVLHMERRYDAGAPSALDVLFAAAEGRHGPIRQIAGSVRVENGAVICEPLSLSADILIVPDIDAADHAVEPLAIAGTAAAASDLELARRFLAGALHAGSRRREADFLARGKKIAAALDDDGYVTTAAKFSKWLLAESDDTALFGQSAIWLLAMQEAIP